MIPFYDYSMNAQENMRRSYEQGIRDMRQKIYTEISKMADSEKDFDLMLMIRNLKVE